MKKKKTKPKKIIIKKHHTHTQRQTTKNLLLYQTSNFLSDGDDKNFNMTFKLKNILYRFIMSK